MRILYIVHDLHVGGAERIVASYVLKLKEKGEDITLLELSHKNSFLADEVQKSEIPYYTLSFPSIFDRLLVKVNPTCYKKKFNKLVHDINPDIIHFQTLTRYMLVTDFPLNRCLYTFHSRLSRTYKKGGWVKKLFDYVNQKGMHFVAISSNIEEDIRKNLPNSFCHSIPNGVDLSEIRTLHHDKMNIRKELCIDSDAFVVGQVGRFNPVKNHIFTIEVFKKIVQFKNNALLVFVGDGSDGETQNLKNKVSFYGLQDRVLFLGLRNDAERIMTCFDVLIHPSISESFSLVLIEAQANNVRCVASDAIPSEVICNSNCSQLSLGAPVNDWVNAILSEEDNGVLKNIELFNIDNVINKHLELYKTLK